MTCITWAVDSLLLPGKTCSGDQHLVCETEEGTLVAVIDGLGHGEEAAAAALIATSLLERQASSDLVSLIRYCHEHLRTTRGAVMSLAHFNRYGRTLSWIGVGNVGGILLGNNGTDPQLRSLLLRGGVVGQQLPALQLSTLPVSPGDTLILTTDGVKGDFNEAIASGASPQLLAERILSHSNGADEALVLVARYKEGER
jgi:serine/threonine protein phosphatase PrpC